MARGGGADSGGSLARLTPNSQWAADGASMRGAGGLTSHNNKGEKGGSRQKVLQSSLCVLRGAEAVPLREFLMRK